MSEVTHPAPFTLERLVAEDLAAAERDSVSAHVTGCERCRAEVDRLRADIDAFTSEVSFASFASGQRVRQARRAHLRTLRFGFPLALGFSMAVAAVLVTVVPRHSEDGYVGIKGTGVGLSFAVREEGKARQGLVGETLSQGSVLQLSYHAGRHGYVALLGIDGAGVVTVYYPASGQRLAALPSGEAGTFPFSLTLDGTPGIERFVAVFANEPAPLETARAAVAAMGTTGREPALPPDLVASTVWVRH